MSEATAIAPVTRMLLSVWALDCPRLTGLHILYIATTDDDEPVAVLAYLSTWN